MADVAKQKVWTFTGLFNVDLGESTEIELGDGFFLCKPTPFLLSARSRVDLSGRQFQEAEALSCFFVHRAPLPLERGPERDEKIEYFQHGLMAVQILKPVRTFGFIFQGSEHGADYLSLETINSRAPMNPGEWARMRAFDSEFIPQIPSVRQRVMQVMRETVAESKNAINLLQLGLEHHHPLIAGLLAVMGLEALFDSDNRQQFHDKLCQCLGVLATAFPDWNSSNSLRCPTYTVDEIAIDLYTLRSKIAHGVDLREAARDPKFSVDLLRKVTLIPDLPTRAYALLLSEAATYLLCQVLQKIM